MVWLEEGARKFTKEEIKRMLKNDTLPKHLREIFEEAKSWWYHCGDEVIKDNYHLLNPPEVRS